jgi:hypothetical protein
LSNENLGSWIVRIHPPNFRFGFFLRGTADQVGIPLFGAAFFEANPYQNDKAFIDKYAPVGGAGKPIWLPWLN